MANDLYKVNVNPESNNLLRIIHEGIDNIILRLKIEVDKKGENGTYGTTVKTNDAVVKILKVFSDFQDGKIIDENQVMKEKIIGDNKEVIQTQNFLTPHYFGSNKSAVVSNTGLLKQNLLTESIKDIGEKEADILDLNTGINYNTYHSDGYSEYISIKNEQNSQLPLINRLNNCKNLEKLYLKKHEEIIKIFGFVVNLFDKYKYAIKVILFLLKNLVRAEQKDIPPGEPGSVSVKLPKPLITNIDLLLKDQENIQTIIDGMEKVVDKTHTAINTNVEPDINKSLEAQGSPPGPATAPPAP